MMRETSPGSRWFAFRDVRSDVRLRLFCFPHAGGGASVYRTWADRLPSSVELCPIQLPAREARLKEPAFRRLPPLLDALGDVLHPYLDIPFALVGHSLGAMIAFELARWFRREAMPSPVHLFISGRPAPQIEEPYPLVSHLPDAEFLEEIRQYQGTPEPVLRSHELMRMLIPIIRADFELAESHHYVTEEPLSVPISAFAGRSDPGAGPAQMEGWIEQTQGAFTLRTFPGGHFFLHEQRADVLRELSLDLIPYLT